MSIREDWLNTITCGDCFELIRQLPDESIDLVVTDPPYGIDYQSNRRTAREKLPKFANDVSLEWVGDWVDEMHRVLKNDTHFYCFTRYDTYPVFYAEITRRFDVKNCLIWVKNNHGSGDLNGSYAPQYEMIIFAHKGKRHLNGKRDADVMECDNVPSAQRFHATQKPVELLRVLVEKSSDPGDIILDPFAGTGSAGLACKAASHHEGDGQERSFVLFELNPEFVSKARVGGLGRQLQLLDVKRDKKNLLEPKLRSTIRARRYMARKDQTLWLTLEA